MEGDISDLKSGHHTENVTVRTEVMHNNLVESLTPSQPPDSHINIKQEPLNGEDNVDIPEFDFQAEHMGELETVNESEVFNEWTEHNSHVKSENVIDSFDDRALIQPSSNLVYRCKYCSQQLQKLSTLQKHEDAHRNGTIYKCRYCEYYSLQRDRIQSHERKHTGERPFFCNRCDFTCATNADLKRHKLTHCSTKRYNCPICPFRSKRPGGVSKHMRVHSDDRPFSCTLCCGTFKRKATLDNHMKLHSSLKPFHCDMCNYSCKTQNHLTLHKKTHSDVRNFPCTHPGCLQRCKTRSDLMKHQSVHMTSLDFKCILCQKRFKSRQTLLVHTRGHEKKPFPCTVCGKVLHSKPNLKKHLSLHQGDKKFVCQYCHRKFSNRYNLKAHLIIHDESRTFRCPLCVSSFLTANHLFTHIGARHGRDYVYFCEICQRPFSRYLRIKTHIERNHKDPSTNIEEFVYNDKCWFSDLDRKSEDSKEPNSQIDGEMELEGGNTAVSVLTGTEENSIPVPLLPLQPDSLDGIRAKEEMQTRRPTSAPSLCFKDHHDQDVSNDITGNGSIIEELENSSSFLSSCSKDVRHDQDVSNDVTKIDHTNEVLENSTSSLCYSKNIYHDQAVPNDIIGNCSFVSKSENVIITVNSHEPNQVNVSQSPTATRSSSDVGNAILEAVDVGRCNAENGITPTGLVTRELIIKLDRIPGRFGVDTSAASVAQYSEKKCEKVIKIGTYASVGIFLAGRDSGMKFNLKRGMKSLSSKWFMDPKHMTPAAAHKTNAYLKNQKRKSCRTESSRAGRKRKARAEVINEKRNSVPLLHSVKRKRSTKKAMTASETSQTCVQSEQADAKVHLSLHQPSDCCLTVPCSSQQTSSHSQSNATPLQTQRKKSNAGRRKKTISAQGKCQRSPRKSQKMSRKEKPSNSVLQINDSNWRLDSGCEQILTGTENSSEDQRLPVIRSGLPAVAQVGGSVVVGVEQVADSPFQITWKKVGGRKRGRPRKQQTAPIDGLKIKEVGQNPVANHVTPDLSGGYKHKGNSVILGGDGEIGGSSEDVMTGSDEFVMTNEKISMTEKQNEKVGLVTLQREGKKEILSEKDGCTFVNNALSPNRAWPDSNVKVLSLKEFEEEYRHRPKIVANISVVHKPSSTPVTAGKVKRKRKTNSENRKVKTKKCARQTCDKFSVVQDNLSYQPTDGGNQFHGENSDFPSNSNLSAGERDNTEALSSQEIKEENKSQEKPVMATLTASAPKKQSIPPPTGRGGKRRKAHAERKKIDQEQGILRPCEIRLKPIESVEESILRNNASTSQAIPKPHYFHSNSTPATTVRVNASDVSEMPHFQARIPNKPKRTKQQKKSAFRHGPTQTKASLVLSISKLSPEIETYQCKPLNAKTKRTKLTPFNSSLNSKRKSKGQGKLKIAGLLGTVVKQKNAHDSLRKGFCSRTKAGKNIKGEKKGVNFKKVTGMPDQISVIKTKKTASKGNGTITVGKKSCKRDKTTIARKKRTVKSQSLAHRKSVSGNRIKLPGLMSTNSNERRLTVECVTSLPKVVLHKASWDRPQAFPTAGPDMPDANLHQQGYSHQWRQSQEPGVKLDSTTVAVSHPMLSKPEPLSFDSNIGVDMEDCPHGTGEDTRVKLEMEVITNDNLDMGVFCKQSTMEHSESQISDAGYEDESSFPVDLNVMDSNSPALCPSQPYPTSLTIASCWSCAEAGGDCCPSHHGVQTAVPEETDVCLEESAPFVVELGDDNQIIQSQNSTGS